MQVRELKITCSNEDEAHKLAQLILENVKLCELSLSIKDNTIRVTLMGLKPEIKSAIIKIRELKRELALEKASGRIALSSVDIAKRIRATAPLEPIAIVLARQGYDAKVLKGGILETNAPLEKVLSIASAIATAIQELKFKARGQSTKKFIAAACAATGASTEEVIDVALKLELLKEDEDGKLVVTKEWRQALNTLLNMYGPVGVQGVER